MADASAHLDFERAAELRDVLRKLETMEEPTVVLQVEGGDRDVIGYARDGEEAVVAVLRIRAGKLLAREHHFLDNVEEEPDATVLAAYLARAYLTLEERAPELLVPFDFDDRELFAVSLSGTRIHIPQRGPRREIVDLAQQNARHLLEEFRLVSDETTERAGDPIYELQRELGLQRLPRAIVCFDISHAQGTDTVASCVWFQNGRPLRAEYRKFKIKTVEGIDDFASMNEVVTRFVSRRIEEEKALPDLIVIDGGKGQLNAARDALAALGIQLPIISLAKRDEEIFVPGRTESVRLSRRSPALRVLQQARDEAHRFAVTFQRQRRAARTVTSELLSIPGVGPAKRRALLRAFGSVQGVRDAAPEAIAALPGFSLASARKVQEALARSNPVNGAEPAHPAIASTVQDVDLVVPDAAARELPDAGNAHPLPILPES
jgi:excinuclease ABC subunit C